jgi:hypothetical protein
MAFYIFLISTEILVAGVLKPLALQIMIAFNEDWLQHSNELAEIKSKRILEIESRKSDNSR